MKRKNTQKTIARRALRITQTKGHPLFLFCLTGEELLEIAEISRVSRDDTGKLIGYQRPEVKRHVQDITDYLDSGKVLFPNSIILALSSKVHFSQSRGPRVSDRVSDAGILEITFQSNGTKPAWIVDGQQRAIAISHSKRKDLPIPVSAFVADEIELQRDQFLRVNNTKPLPRGLITELLPEVSSPLPAALEMRKIPSAICDALNSNENSPFRGLISRASMTAAARKKAVITDTSIIKMLEESLTTPSGCLFPYRNIATGDTDTDGIWATVVAYWTAVRNVFPDAWGKPAQKSRLMHGAGMRAMGRLMDRIMATVDPRTNGVSKHVEDELRSIAPMCHWTSGQWDELSGLKWNEIQNVPRHINALSNVLLRGYIHRRVAAR
jgi:DGQHR domain-containing protein